MSDFYYFDFGQQQRNEEFNKRNKIYESLASPLLFVNWLSKFEQTDEIGKRGLGDEEPIIKFLYETTGVLCGLLDNTSLHVFPVAGNITLPGWVTRYLIKLTSNGNQYGDPATPKDCIAALE